MSKALIVYATRFGATKSTSDEVAKILSEENFDVKVVNAKEDKIQEIDGYSLIVVGSGMSMGNWATEAEDFLKKFQRELDGKKLALFVSSLKPVEEKQGKTDLVNRIQKIGIDDKIQKYHFNPISTAVFGGIVDYTKMNFIIKKSMEIGYKSALQKHGFKEIQPGVYDLRDWNQIETWAREIAKKAKVGSI
jgi:menaquinone-dependent protoporphyrinogen IX oxidase